MSAPSALKRSSLRPASALVSLGGHARVARRLLPWLLFSAAAAAATALGGWTGHGSARGYAPLAVHALKSPLAARVSRILVSEGTHVLRGTPLLELEERTVRESLAVLEAERARILARLQLRSRTAESDASLQKANLAEATEARRAMLEETQSRAEIARANLDTLEKQVVETTAAVEKRLVEKLVLDELIAKRNLARAEWNSADDLQRRLAIHAKQANSREERHRGEDTSLVVADGEAELALVDVKIENLKHTLEELIVRAPKDGNVGALLVREGTLVGSQDLLLEFHESTPPREITLCVSASDAQQLKIGQHFEGHREGAGTKFRGRVTEVSRVESAFPERCKLPNEHTARFGHLVQGEIMSGSLAPGSAVLVAFEGTVDRMPPATPSKGVPPATPSSVEVRPLKLPAELARRSRLEPSGAVFSPELGKFLVPSDDTGRDESTEGQPWLFVLNTDGSFEPEPLRLEGLSELKDAESIARSSDGTYYVASSQTKSRAGNLGPAREVLLSFRINEGRARVEHHIRLRSALQKLPVEERTRLGLLELDELEIEGLTSDATGSLLFGLKGPLSSERKALVWRLTRPSELLTSGQLSSGQLAVAYEFALPLTADGHSANGGISDLHWLSSGELLIASTVSGRDVGTQDGALFLRPANGQVRRIATYPGRKPEGIAVAPNKREILVVFDEGDNAPSYLWQPW